MYTDDEYAHTMVHLRGYSRTFVKNVERKRKEALARARAELSGKKKSPSKQAREANRKRAVPAATAEQVERSAKMLAEIEAIEARYIMFGRSMPKWARNIVFEVAARHNVSPAAIVGPRRFDRVARARNEVFYEIRRTAMVTFGGLRASWPIIAAWFAKDHTSLIYGAARHAKDTGAESLTTMDLDRKLAIRAKWWAANRSFYQQGSAK